MEKLYIKPVEARLQHSFFFVGRLVCLVRPKHLRASDFFPCVQDDLGHSSFLEHPGKMTYHWEMGSRLLQKHFFFFFFPVFGPTVWAAYCSVSHNVNIYRISVVK